MIKQKYSWFALGFIVVLLLLYWIFSQKQNQSYTLTAPLKRSSILESVYGIGTVTARRSYQIKSGVTNSIQKLYVREGDFVHRNEKLLELDSTIFRAQFDGTVTWIPAKEGELAFAQSVILTLVDLTDRYVIVSLDQRGALRVKKGQTAKINFDSIRDESYSGTVESVYSNNTDFLVRIDITGLPSQILPAMTGDVAIGISEHKNAWVVPISTIRDGKVLVKQQTGKPKDLAVKIGIVDGTNAEIISEGLNEGDQLVIQSTVVKP
ncbi:MAG: hypothetical protein A2622_01855 [Bdellovibrionales bacterium RIFCSPHIGHO2_01_FULL_40_29]|nr:MAG: hypothetical protein A2622_01855 [Bdellovibrionales bacterium RIFCSPHIGHO2_01_FULL_40_29]OFZ33836.1 MAG: hypothetical protein A3D17_02275 [Bdellovibrionales bacterium RIFCSPHIGHO2_02_FULL_40_15]